MALDSIGAPWSGGACSGPCSSASAARTARTWWPRCRPTDSGNDPVLQGMAVYIRPCYERMLLDRVVESLAAGDDVADTLELLTLVMGAETLEADGVVLLLNDDRRSARSITALDLAGGLRVDNARDGTPWSRAMDDGAPVWAPIDELPLDLRALAPTPTATGGAGRGRSPATAALAAASCCGGAATRRRITRARSCSRTWCASPGSSSTASGRRRSCCSPPPTTR